MAEVINAVSPLSFIATTSSRMRELLIKDGQIIFLHDVGRIAMDFKGKRTFYNQIVELASEAERQSLADVLDGFYFVIETACLWKYSGEWVQITKQPDDIVFIGGSQEDFPSLGKPCSLYVNKVDKNISIFDENTGGYTVVADKTNLETVDENDINALFV